MKASKVFSFCLFYALKSAMFYDENKAVLIKKVSNEYDLNKRLLLGLPVSPDECGGYKIF